MNFESNGSGTVWALEPSRQQQNGRSASDLLSRSFQRNLPLEWHSTAFKILKHYNQTDILFVPRSSFLFSACTSHNCCWLIVGAKQTDGERKRATDGSEREREWKGSGNSATNGLLTQTYKKNPAQFHVLESCNVSSLPFISSRWLL